MSSKQNIVVVQNNNGGCGCGCGTLIGIIILLGLLGTLLDKYGPIVMAVAGFFLGAWGGLKVSGVPIEELNAIAEDDWGPRQWRGSIFMLGGGILFAIGGWEMGQEIMKEMNDNREALLHLLKLNSA